MAHESNEAHGKTYRNQMTLTIKHGLRQANRQYNTAPTVGDIKRDTSLRMELGYGDNVNVVVGGVPQADFVQLHGPICTVETAANEKNG